MTYREFLMQPYQYHPGKYNVSGWYISERLAGIRAFWDGGASRGMRIQEVPWASSYEIPQATGLWNQYAEVIEMSEAFLNYFPPLMLDGILVECEYAAFSSPHPDNFALDGLIKHPNLAMNADRISEFIIRRNKALGGPLLRVIDGADYEEELACLRDAFDNDTVYLLRQRKLPEKNPEEIIEDTLYKALNNGNVGVMLRDPTSQWEPRQTRCWLEYTK